MPLSRRYTVKEERYNAYTHAFGVVVSLVAGVVLVQKALFLHNLWAVVSYSVFVFFMTLMYLSSTVYHAEKNERIKPLRRKFDHAAIYAQIAGSYTPFTLVVLRERGAWGWSLFGVIWTAALVGILLSFMKLKNGSKLETICYVAMGWVVAVAFKPLIDALIITDSLSSLYWLIGGGLFYTIGSVLYSMKKIKYMHAIWHLFVLGGSICHVIAVWKIK